MVPFSLSLKILLKKDYRNTVRNPVMVRFSFLTFTFVPLYIAGMYASFGGNFDQQPGTNAVIGFLFYMAFSTFLSALFPVVSVFPT